MGDRLDIAIAGSGTAGLAAAALLARDGHRVIVFERFAEAQPVGSGLMLQPTGMAVLRKLGLAERTQSLGSRIECLHGIAEGRTVLNVRYGSLARGDCFGLGIHRASLFQILYEAAFASGAVIATGHEIVASRCAKAKRFLTFSNGQEEGPFDLVIDAAGGRSSLSNAAGRLLAYGALWSTVEWREGVVPNSVLSQRYRHASVMAGILPIGNLPASSRKLAALFWSVRADRLDALKKEGIVRWRQQWSDIWPEAATYAEQIESFEQMQFARYAHRTLAKPVEERLIHVGDAWHSTSPQLGQGANMALVDAYALALALRRNADVNSALADAISRRRSHVSLYQWLSLLLTPVYQSDGRAIPFLRDRLVGPLSDLEIISRLQAKLVAGLVGAPLKRLGLE